MKNQKFLFVLVAAASLLAGCSSSDDVAAGESVQNPVDDRVVINFRTALSGTRGTGTVGGIQGAADNVWAGQTFQLYMFNRNTLDLAEDDNGQIMFNGKIFTTPNVMAGVSMSETAKDLTNATVVNNGLTVTEKVHYYPQNGSYDFWAVRLDDAPYSVAPSVDGNKLLANFTIDGTQDIMVAKATPYLATQDPADPTIWVSSTNKQVPETYIFSAYAARRDIDPVLNFRHLLTRLHFVVTGENQEMCDESTDPTNKSLTIANPYAVKVQSISVTSRVKGDLSIAYTGTVSIDGRIDWAADENDLVLKQRATGVENPANSPMETLSPISPIWNTTTNVAYETPVGEAMLLCPQTQYQMRINMTRKVPDTERTDYYPISHDFGGVTYYFQEEGSAYTAWELDGFPASGPTYDAYVVWVVTGKTAADGVVEDKILAVTTWDEIPYSKDITLTTATGVAFERGKSYKVSIKLYGPERIDLNTELEGWIEDSGTIERNTDQN